MFEEQLSWLGKKYQFHRLKRSYQRKISQFTRGLDEKGVKVLTPEQQQEARSYWKKFGHDIDLSWHRCYSNGPAGFDPRIIPEYIYYAVTERKLNRKKFAGAYMDKNIYDKIFPRSYLPTSYIKMERGNLFNGEMETIVEKEADRILRDIGEDIVVKRTIGSYGGKDILFLDKDLRSSEGGKFNSIKSVVERLGNDFIIQEKVQQHHDIGRFHPSSLNTIRMMTLRFDGKIEELSTVLRFGMNNSLVDNISQGGFALGVSPDGRMASVGNWDMVNDMKEHPLTKEVFEGSKVPGYDKIRKMAFELHGILTQFDILSWDLTVNKEGTPVFIEVNIMGQGLHHHQYYNGPLFGDLTDRILKL